MQRKLEIEIAAWHVILPKPLHVADTVCAAKAVVDSVLHGCVSAERIEGEFPVISLTSSGFNAGRILWSQQSRLVRGGSLKQSQSIRALKLLVELL